MTPGKPLSPTMRLILQLLEAGESPFKGARGRSEHGGRARALMALKLRGLREAEERGRGTLGGEGKGVASSDALSYPPGRLTPGNSTKTSRIRSRE
jgi:hypothetical protein